MTTLPNPFTFSQSSLQDYMDCPRRFQLRYIEQLAWPGAGPEDESRLLEGQVFHRLVQQQLLGLPADTLGRMANTPNLERWWKHWLEFGRPELAGRLLPELTLSGPVGAHRLLAKYDLLAIQDGRALIYDWKTYARRPRPEWLSARWQTRVYRALLVQAGAQLNGGAPWEPGQIEMIYWFADFPSDPVRLPYDAAQFQRDVSALAKVIGEIASAERFELTEDESLCRYCAYRSYCKRGVPAAGPDQAEAEAASEAVFDVNFEQITEIDF